MLQSPTVTRPARCRSTLSWRRQRRAAALDGLRRQRRGWHATTATALAQTAHWRTSDDALNTSVAESPDVGPAPWMQRFEERGHTTNGVSPPERSMVSHCVGRVLALRTDGAAWMEAN